MVARAIEAADVGQEGFSTELGGSTYRIMQVLSKGPQSERYVATRFFGIGFATKTKAELMSEMDLDSDGFDSLLKRAVHRLREAQRG